MKELETLMEEASKEANRIKDEVFLETLKTFRERCKYYLDIEKHIVEKVKEEDIKNLKELVKD